MKEKQNREAKLPSKLLTSKKTPRPRLGRCPHLLNLTAKLERNSKNEKMLDLAYVLPTQRLIEEGRPYHFPSYTMSSNNQAKREEEVHY